jgi:hypothetical protein|tara:strand:- start:292 stop:438 length:147 start_codon:yes stop_codon:yes gene_type:complete
MARMFSGGTVPFQKAPPKKTRQGRSVNTKLAATSRNGKKKIYRGQGRG